MADNPHNSVVAIEPGKPDKVVAEEFKSRLAAALEPVCKIVEEAHRMGLTIEFGTSTTPFGRHVISNLRVYRVL